MQPLFVVETDEGGYPLLCVQTALKAHLTVDNLRLDRTVHALRNGIVRRFLVLRHTYLYTIFL